MFARRRESDSRQGLKVRSKLPKSEGLLPRDDAAGLRVKKPSIAGRLRKRDYVAPRYSAARCPAARWRSASQPPGD